MQLVLNNADQPANNFTINLVRPMIKESVKLLRVILLNVEKLPKDPVFLYCSLCEPRMIGTTFSPLLDVFILSSNQFDIPHPLEHPCVNESVSSISIQLLQSNGSLLTLPDKCQIFIILEVE